MIHVCYCFSDKTGRYAKFAGTSALSLFENTNSDVTIHILHDNTLTDDNRDKFNYLAGRYSQSVKFYNVAQLLPNKVEEIIKAVPEVEKAKVTVGTFYKVLIPQILPQKIEKAIFIDPDTLVNLDIKELWQIDLEDKVLGAVREIDNGANPNKSFLLCSEGIVNPEDYFNTGVLLMNLVALRGEEEKIMQGIKFRGENPKQKFFEQTVLNYCFSAQALTLPTKFNCFIKLERQNGEQNLGQKIYHYTGGPSRMYLDMSDPANNLWMSYFVKTPWFNEETIGRLYTSLQKISNDVKNSSLKFTSTLAGKTRAFFIEPKKIDAMKKTFSIGKDELIIPATNDASFKKLLDTMKANRGKCVFFVLTEKFLNKGFPFDTLKKAGFTEGKDFLKGWTFLPSAQNPPHSTYSFIESL